MTPQERLENVRANANSLPIGSHVRALLQHAANEIEILIKEVPSDVCRLVIAARIVAFENQDAETIEELIEASEAFATRVPWEDEPISSCAQGKGAEG